MYKYSRMHHKRKAAHFVLPIPFILLAIENESDRAFMEKLYADFGKLMYHQARLICRSDADAQDTVSDAILALIKKISLLRDMPCNKLKAYTVITVKHLAIDRYRRLQKEDVSREEEGPDAVSETLPEDRLMEAAGVDRIKQAILSLPEREKDAMMMRYFLQHSEEEIARRWQVRPVTVRVTLSRARQHLKALLQERRGEA